MTHPAIARVVAPVALGTLIMPLDTAVNIAFPAITRHFDQPVAMIQWVVICYVLTYGSLMLGIGRLGDIFGYRRVFAAGLAWSAVAFLLCAQAPSYEWLLACRVLQGIGAALVISCGAALITTPFPEALRGRLLGFYATALAAGAALGPVLGGMLVERWGWEAVFWFRAPIALSALLLLRGMPVAARAGPTGNFDLPGAALLALGLASFLLTIRELPHLADAPWRGGTLLLIFAVSLAAFLARTQRAARPVLHLHHFRAVDFALVNLANAALHFAGFAVLLLVPFWLARFSGLAEGVAGLVLAAAPAGGMLAGLLGGHALSRVSPQRLGAIGLVLAGLGLLLVGQWQRDSDVSVLVVSLLVQGAGLGLFQLAYTDIVTATMPREDRGVAGSLAMMTRTLGVVSAASLLTWMQQDIAAAWLAIPVPPETAFLESFRRSFLLVAVIPFGLLAVGLLRAVRRAR